MRGRVIVAVLVVGVAVVLPGSAAAAPMSLGAGGLPDVTVEADGTADVVWNGPEVLSPTLHFCRVPRGGSACSQSVTLTPGGGSVTRPAVFADGPTIRIISYRYGLPQNRDVLYASTDHGASFGPPEEIGDLSPGELAAIPGGKFAGITSATSPVAAQIMTPGAGVPASSASLGTNYIYFGSIAAAGSTVVAVSTSADETTLGFAATSTGNPNTAASWSPFQAIGTGSWGHLASGPSGLFLLAGKNAAAGQVRLSIRRWTGSGFGAPVDVPGTGSADVPSASLTEDAAGELHAFWHDSTGLLFHATSADGASWSPADTVVSGQPTYNALRTSAAGDHGGAAVWTAGGQVYTSFVAPPATQTPPPTTTTPPTPLPGTTYVPARASLSQRTGGIAGRRPLVLDASASRLPGSAVSVFRWDVNGDGKTDATCGGQTPLVEVPISRAGTGTAIVSVVDSAGATTSAALPFRVGGRTARASATTTLKLSAAQVYLCSGGPKVAANPGGGGPANTCDEITYGVVDAIGCFTLTDGAHPIPAREQALVDQAAGLTSTVRASAAHAASSPAQAAPTLTPAQKKVLTSLFPHVATGTVRVNGLDMTPGPGASLVFLPALKEIVSSYATVRYGSVTLQQGKLVAKLPYAKNGVKLTGFNLTRAVPLPGISSLPLEGHVDVILTPQGTDLPVHVGLPSVFTDPITGKGLTGEATLHADNPHGAGTLTALDVKAPDVWLAGIDLHNMFFHYSAATGEEIGGGEVIFPPSGDSISGELGFLRGRFNKLRLDWKAGAGTGVGVGPGVFLTEVGAGFSVNPTELDGTVTVAAGVSVGGGCPAVGVTGNLHMHFAPGPVSLDVNGDGKLVCIPLAHVFFHVDGTGYVKFGGGIDFDFGPFSLNADIAAQFLYPHFQFDGDANGCIDGLGCIGGEAVLSDRGIGFCADFGFTHAGAGVHFDGVLPNIVSVLQHTTVMLDSCDIAQFRSLPKGAAIAQTGGARSITVPADEKVAVLAVSGASAPPSLTLAGPGGRTLHSAPSGSPVRNGNDVIFSSPDTEDRLLPDQSPGRRAVDDHTRPGLDADHRHQDLARTADAAGPCDREGTRRSTRADLPRRTRSRTAGPLRRAGRRRGAHHRHRPRGSRLAAIHPGRREGDLQAHPRRRHSGPPTASDHHRRPLHRRPATDRQTQAIARHATRDHPANHVEVRRDGPELSRKHPTERRPRPGPGHERRAPHAQGHRRRTSHHRDDQGRRRTRPLTRRARHHHQAAHTTLNYRGPARRSSGGARRRWSR